MNALLPAGASRPRILVAAYDTFAEFQIVPCLALLHGCVHVTTAGPTRAPVPTETGLRVAPDMAWDELTAPSFGAVLLAGARDMRAACDADGLKALLRRCAAQDTVIGAICGGPLVLHFAGLLAGHDFSTSLARESCAEAGLEVARYRDDPVVSDGKLVTAKGFATVEFGAAIARRLGFDVASKVSYFQGGRP